MSYLNCFIKTKQMLKMKKVLILATTVLCFVTSILAQESAPNQILRKFEIVAGPSFSKNKGYLSNYDSKIGYSIGVGTSAKFSKSFSVNFRSLYEFKESAASYSFSRSDANNVSLMLTDKYTNRFNYLTFYALPTLQLGSNKRIHISAGGYYSLLLKDNINIYTIESENNNFFSEYNISNEFSFKQKYDAGISVLIGYSFKVGDKSQLLLQAFGNRGLVDISYVLFGSQRNNTFGLLSTFRFN